MTTSCSVDGSGMVGLKPTEATVLTVGRSVGGGDGQVDRAAHHYRHLSLQAG